VVVEVLPSSTVITPSLPTLRIASAICLPISLSEAEIVAICVISLFGFGVDVDFFGVLFEFAHDASTALSMPRLMWVALAPAVMLRKPFGDDALGEHHRRRGAVAGHVVGLGAHFADELGAHVFKGVLQLNVLGDRHAVVGDGGRAEFLVQHHVAALGAEGAFHRFGQFVHAGFDGFAGVVAVFDLFCP
jgi:hypothetical protein